MHGEASNGQLSPLGHALVAHELRHQQRDPLNRQQRLPKPGTLTIRRSQAASREIFIFFLSFATS
jgi:hypothetical protein